MGCASSTQVRRDCWNSASSICAAECLTVFVFTFCFWYVLFYNRLSPITTGTWKRKRNWVVRIRGNVDRIINHSFRPKVPLVKMDKRSCISKRTGVGMHWRSSNKTDRHNRPLESNHPNTSKWLYQKESRKDKPFMYKLPMDVWTPLSYHPDSDPAWHSPSNLRMRFLHPRRMSPPSRRMIRHQQQQQLPSPRMIVRTMALCQASIILIINHRHPRHKQPPLFQTITTHNIIQLPTHKQHQSIPNNKTESVEELAWVRVCVCVSMYP